MSNVKFNNKSAAKSTTTFAKKSFCKVCQDAGKTEAEYTSHFVRSRPDMNGNTKVTCPVLAATECRYCYKLGHTTKFCPVIEENTKRAKKDKSVAIQAQKAQERAAPKPTTQVASNKFAGAFAALIDESDDEKPMPPPAWGMAKVEVEEFPALIGLKKEAAPVAKGSPDGLKPTVSWAAMAEKPAAPVLKPIVKPEMTVLSRSVSKSWADYSDSDSDEEIPSPPPASTYREQCYDSRSSWTDDDW
jgi:hypothetical protein